MAKTCPVCGGELSPVETRSHYGVRMTILTCTETHGYWLKRLASVSVGQAAAAELEAAAPAGELQTQPREESRTCPTCDTAMEEITGDAIPEGLRVDTCPVCRGLWFDRGELLVFKNALEERRKKQEHAEVEAVARSRARRDQGAAAWHVAGFDSPIAGVIDLVLELT